MARGATRDNVAADMRPTDYRGAVKRLETIDNKTTKQQKIAKEIGDVYSAVEGICGVNKTAAKMWRALKKLEAPERIEVFRDLNGLIDAAGWPSEASDLVDQAQGNVVHLRAGQGNGGENDDDEGGVDEETDLNPEEQPERDEFEASEEEIAGQKPRAEAAEAKAVTGRGKKPTADVVGKPKATTTRRPDAEPYTGDNADLAGEA